MRVASFRTLTLGPAPRSFPLLAAKEVIMKRFVGAVTVLSIIAILPAHAFAKDNTPPAAVTDLTVAVGPHTGVPVWTNTGDDGTVGTASSYEVRYSTSPIT